VFKKHFWKGDVTWKSKGVTCSCLWKKRVFKKTLDKNLHMQSLGSSQEAVYIFVSKCPNSMYNILTIANITNITSSTKRSLSYIYFLNIL